MIQNLGFPKLPKVEIEYKDYSLYKKGIGGNVYSWNTHAYKDIPKGLDVCSFYVEDIRFRSLLESSKKAERLLSQFQFKYIIQPDYSVYYDLELIDQIYRTYIGKKIAKTWSNNGFKIIPNLVLGSKDLFEYAIYGIEKGSSFAVQIQANDHNPDQDIIDAETLKKAIEVIEPYSVLVYATQKRIDDLGLKDNPKIIRVKTQIDHLRQYGKK